MKKLIRQVLDELGDTQINLGNKAARETIASLLSATLKEKGEYTEYTKADVKEQELKDKNAKTENMPKAIHAAGTWTYIILTEWLCL